MTKYKCNTNEPLDDRGGALHLTSHFDNNKEYFNKLLSKDFSLAEVYLTLQDKERMKEAYNKAHHVREYEINLFWSRLNYLWAITAVLFAAGGVILNDMINLAEGKEVNELQFLSLFSVSIFGSSLTTVSIFVTKAGKHWQQVWEYHLTALEPFQSGHLYSLKFERKNGSSPSITRSVAIFHIFLLIIWGVLTFFSAVFPFTKDNHILMIVEAIVIVLIYWLFNVIDRYVSKSSDNKLNLL